MPAHRQSALLLHGLSAPDRSWILSRLADADRTILGRHLAELNELGIPADPSLAATSQARPACAAPPTLATASPAQMQRMLADEPAWLLRHLLALGAWPWRDAFVAALPAAQRERMTAAPALSLPAHAAQRLLAQVENRLALSYAPSPATAAPPPGPLASMRAALRRWL